MTKGATDEARTGSALAKQKGKPAQAAQNTQAPESNSAFKVEVRSF